MRACAALCAIVCAAVFAGGAAADSTATVSVPGCVWFQGGHVTVPAGSTVDVRYGWATKNRGLDEAFSHDVTTTASIDGGPVANTAAYWTTPALLGSSPTTWATYWLYPTGVTLGAGDTLTVSLELDAAHPLPDGFGNTAAGDVFSGTCTITGV